MPYQKGQIVDLVSRSSLSFDLIGSEMTMNLTKHPCFIGETKNRVYY